MAVSHVGFEWAKCCDKDVESKIKLLSSDEKWVLNVAGNDIDLFSVGHSECGCGCEGVCVCV